MMLTKWNAQILRDCHWFRPNVWRFLNSVCSIEMWQLNKRVNFLWFCELLTFERIKLLSENLLWNISTKESLSRIKFRILSYFWALYSYTQNCLISNWIFFFGNEKQNNTQIAHILLSERIKCEWTFKQSASKIKFSKKKCVEPRYCSLQRQFISKFDKYFLLEIYCTNQTCFGSYLFFFCLSVESGKQ